MSDIASTDDTPPDGAPVPDSDTTPPSGTSLPPSPLERIVANEVRLKELRGNFVRAVHDRDEQHVESSKTLAGVLVKIDTCITDVRAGRSRADMQHAALKGEIAKVHNRQLAEAQWTRAALGDIYEALGGQTRELGMRAKADSVHDEQLVEVKRALTVRRVIAGGVAGGLLLTGGALIEKLRMFLGGLGK